MIAMLFICVTNAYANNIKKYNANLLSIEKLEKKIENIKAQKQSTLKRINSHKRKLASTEKKLDYLDSDITAHQKLLSIQLRHLQKFQKYSILKRLANPISYNQTQHHSQMIKEFPRLHINILTVLNSLQENQRKSKKTRDDHLISLTTKLKKIKKIEAKLIKEQKKRQNKIAERKRLLKQKKIAQYARKKSNKKLLEKISLTTKQHNKFKIKKSFRDYKGQLKWPTRGVVRQKKGRKNFAWEILNKKIMPVRAIAPGEVVFSGRLGILGKVIIIDHGGKYRSVYAHLDSLHTKKGEIVKAYQIISQSGNTGGRENRGIVFELRYGRKNIDFSKWLKNA
jgi:septal ring factor EnvC (AmiA/AmiB activator)